MVNHGRYETSSHSPRRERSLIRVDERVSVGVFDDLGGEWRKKWDWRRG
jgi:hypothetical protein